MLLIKYLNKYRRLKFNKYSSKFAFIGTDNDIDYGTKFHYPERIKFGSFVYIGPGAEINGLGGVEIKSGVIIGPNLFLHSANHKYKEANYIPYDETFDFRKVTIGENVWIGGNVIICPGAEIGEGSIIGAGTVVSGTIPELSIVVGNPCRVIKGRDKEHYYKLKNENRIYLKEKKRLGLEPDIEDGFYN